MQTHAQTEGYDDRWMFLSHVGSSIVASFSATTLEAIVTIQFRDLTEDDVYHSFVSVRRRYAQSVDAVPDMPMMFARVKSLVTHLCSTHRYTVDEIVDVMEPFGWRVVK